MIGKSLGRYRIVQNLGQGGMGEVWRAEDPVLDRDVALKILPRELSELPDARARFLREAKVASTLSHPGIASVFDAGEQENRLYIAFELIEGQPVGELARKNPLTLGRIADMGTQAAHALSHAHGRGVLHRDITSGNIMVTGSGRVVIVDFGLALPEGATRFTLTGKVMGTASYMSPEAARGEAGDSRSDIYGLGAVLYEMLVGRPPFTGTSPYDVLLAVIREPVEPPRASRGDIPRGLQRIVVRCLAKKPDDRYADASTLADELEAVGKRMGPSDRADPLRVTVPVPPSGQENTKPADRPRRTRSIAFPRLSRWRDLGLSLIFLLMAIGLFRTVDPFGWWSITGRYSSLAVLPLENVSPVPGEGEYLNQGLGSGLAGRLSWLPGFRVPGWQSSRRFSENATTLKAIAGELGVELLLTGRFSKEQDRITGILVVMDTVSQDPVWGPAEFTESVDDYLDLEAAMARAVAGELVSGMSDEDFSRVTRSPTSSGKAYDLYLRGMQVFRNGTGSAIEAALEYAERALELDPRLAEAHVMAGAAMLERYYRSLEGGGENLDRAEENFRTALALHPGMTDARRGLIHLLFHEGRVRELLELARDDADRTADGLLMRAEAYHFGGLHSKGAKHFAEVLEMEPGNSAAAFYRVLALGWSGRHEEAVEAGNEFLRMYGDDPDVHQVMGGAYLELGDHENARHHYERANYPVFLGAYLLDTGNEEEAVRVLERGLDSVVHKLAAYSDNSRTRLEKALLHAMLDDREAFDQEADRLLEDDPENEWVKAQLVVGYLRFEDHDRVEALLREAIDRDRVLEIQLAYRRGFMNMGEFLDAPRYRILRGQFEDTLERLRKAY